MTTKTMTTTLDKFTKQRNSQWTGEELEAFPELVKYDPKYFILPKDRQLYLGIFNGVSRILSAFESRKYKTIRTMKKSSEQAVKPSMGGVRFEG